MGSGLFDYRQHTTKFRGKDVAMEIRPLKTKEMGLVLPFFMDLQKFKEKMVVKDLGEGKQKVTVEDPEAIKRLFELQEKAIEILPGAVRNLVGIEDDWKTVCEEVYYFSFVLDIVMHLFQITQLTESDAKN